jgi:hypothetical protein
MAAITSAFPPSLYSPPTAPTGHPYTFHSLSLSLSIVGVELLFRRFITITQPPHHRSSLDEAPDMILVLPSPFSAMTYKLP